jgi:putative chitinase
MNDHWLGMMEIRTVPRLRYLLAQLGHESQGLTVFEENLNYSAQGLRTVFGKYFRTDADARAYARNPERIANRVYANRMGNGPGSSGDGWRYRGQGPIQLTGKANYIAVDQDFPELDCVNNPRILATPAGGMAALVSYWLRNGCNRFADERNFVGLSKKINLGNENSKATPNGLEDRYRWRAIVEQVI